MPHGKYRVPGDSYSQMIFTSECARTFGEDNVKVPVSYVRTASQQRIKIEKAGKTMVANENRNDRPV